jgi:hypothetical protein
MTGYFNGEDKIFLESGRIFSSYSGYCSFCGSEHVFHGDDHHLSGQVLMEQLAKRKGIGPGDSGYSAPKRLSTDPLFGPSRGKMFGVMECLAVDGTTVCCKAFSGQFNGLWLVDGWVPPLFDVDEWTRVNTGPEFMIKTLSAEKMACQDDHERNKRLQQERKKLSQKLMQDLHALYRLTNFRGRTLSLPDIFPEGTGIPTGTGDCCAPKLLNFAATHNLVPIGISEFFWGLENKSAKRQHGHFYNPCTEKCQPILGFMFCGLDELYARQRL